MLAADPGAKAIVFSQFTSMCVEGGGWEGGG